MNSPPKDLSLEQEWIVKAKLIRCPAPLPETSRDPVLIKMLEVAPSEEGEGGHRGTTTSAKEAFSKGGIKSPSFQGEKRTASEDPEAKASKRGKKSSPEGPAPGEAPAALFPQGVVSDPKYFNSKSMLSFSSEKITTTSILHFRP